LTGGKFVHRQELGAGDMGRAVVTFVVTDMHNHQVRIAEVVSQLLGRRCKFWMRGPRGTHPQNTEKPTAHSTAESAKLT
jgi:hypothetical protein